MFSFGNLWKLRLRRQQVFKLPPALAEGRELLKNGFSRGGSEGLAEHAEFKRIDGPYRRAHAQ